VGRPVPVQVRPSAPFRDLGCNFNELRPLYFGRLRIGCGWLGSVELVDSTSVGTRNKMPVYVHGNLNAGMS